MRRAQSPGMPSDGHTEGATSHPGALCPVHGTVARPLRGRALLFSTPDTSRARSARPTCRSEVYLPVSGFTLIEVLATLTIFLILLGMALKPATRWHREQRIRGAVHVAQSTLRLARETAMARRETVYARFLNIAQPAGAIRCYYWIEGESSGPLGVSNAMPDGVAVSLGTYQSTQGFDGVAAVIADNPDLGIVRAVLVASNGPAWTDWALISTSGQDIAFRADGSALGNPWTHVELVEARETHTDPALTGTVSMTMQVGLSLTTARSL